MKEYIEREAFLSVLLDIVTDYEELDDCTAETIKMCIRELNKAPTADVVERKRGEWKLHGNDDDCGSSYFCSNCHKSYDEDWFYRHGVFEPFNACPNCFADMREVDHA